MERITLKKTDIEQSLEIRNANGWLGQPGHGQWLGFTDEHTSQTWNFVYSNTGNKSSLGGQGWLDFVQSKGLSAGSKISLSRNGNNYTIKVIKK
ncbi:hypothetical protein SLA2020_324460 [Shorea laevis]